MEVLDRTESHHPNAPTAHTRIRAPRLKTIEARVDLGFRVRAAAGESVGRGGGISGVAGERWVMSTLLV